MLQNRQLLLAFLALLLHIELAEPIEEIEGTSREEEREHHCAFVYQVILSFREIFNELKAANRRCNGSSFSTWIARLAGECDVDKMLERDNDTEDLARKIRALGVETEKCGGAGLE